MNDLFDRHGTAWHRAWMILTGLWLAALASHLPAALGVVVSIVAAAMVATAAGLLELATALWYRHLSEPVGRTWLSLRPRLTERSRAQDDSPVPR